MNQKNNKITKCIEPDRDGGSRSKDPGYAGIQECESNTVILGEIIACHVCQAYLDGLLRQTADGFCPLCGTHLTTMKEKQKRKFRLLRQNRISRVS